MELQLIPMIIARWLNPIQIKIINEIGGVYIVYKDAIYSTTYSSIISKIREILEFPIESRDEIDDDFFIRKIDKIHSNILKI